MLAAFKSQNFAVLVLAVLFPLCNAAFKPQFQLGDKVDVYLWISTDSDPYLRKGALLKSPPLYNISVSFEWEMSVAPANFSVKIPEKVRSNRSSLYGHLFLCQSGVHPNPWNTEEQDRNFNLKVILRTTTITRVIPEVKKPHKRNLIFDPVPETNLAKSEQRILPHFVPRLQAFVVIDQNTYPALTQEYLSPFILYYLQNLNAVDHKKRVDLPILHFDELSILSKDLIPLNSSSVELDCEIRFQPLGLTRYEWMLKMEQSVQTHKDLGTPESEMEEVRRCEETTHQDARAPRRPGPRTRTQARIPHACDHQPPRPVNPPAGAAQSW